MNVVSIMNDCLCPPELKMNQNQHLSHYDVLAMFNSLEVTAEIEQNKPFFPSIISNQFRTQLNAISFFASLLRLENHHTEQNKYQYLESIQVAVEQLSQFMDEVLVTDRTEIRKKSLLPGVLSVNQPLEEQNNTLHQHYSSQQEDIELSTDQSSDSIELNKLKLSSPHLNQVFEFIEANYAQPMNVSSVAKAVGYSPTYLSNLVKSKTGRTIHDWIVENRMLKARSLLLETDLPVNQIAAMVGYPDAGHFIRQFRQLYDMPPKMWRNKYRN
jgi:AraC-like DNA-binding protein